MVIFENIRINQRNIILLNENLKTVFLKFFITISIIIIQYINVNKRKTVLFKRSLTIIDLLRKSKKKGVIRCKKSRIDMDLSSYAFLKKIRKTGINIRAIKGDVSKGDFKSIKLRLASEF